MLQIILLVLALYGAYHYFFMRKRWNLPPGPRGIPLIGNLLAISGRPYITYTKWREQYGDIFHCFFGTIRVVVLSNVQQIKECFNDPVFSGRTEKMMICILSDGKHGIVSSDGQEWQEQRRFTLRHLRDFGFGKNDMEDLIIEEVDDFNAMLKSHEDTSIMLNGHKFEMPVLNSLWMILTGKKFRHDDQRQLTMLKEIDEKFTKPSVTGILNLLAPWTLKIAPGLLGMNYCKALAGRFHEMLRETIQEHDDTLPDEENPRDFIDAYIHEIKRTKDKDSSFYREAGYRSLLAIVGDMFFAGSETTSSTLAWTVLYLAVNPQVQEKLQEELDSVVGKSRHVSLSDKSKLLYTEATILEVLRKSSLVVTGVMHTAMRDSTFGGYDIPKDTWIMPNIYAIHHDPKIWGDPHTFRPERFIAEDGKTIQKSENLLPFSLGKRICIGEHLARDEIFLFMSNIFQRFSITWDPAKPKPDYEAKPGFLLQPEDFHVIVKDRLK